MNWAAIKWAIARKIRPGSRKWVFVALCSHVNGEGKAWPSISKLQEETGLQRETICDALDHLESAKQIKDTRERKGVTHKTKVYRIVRIPPETVGKRQPLNSWQNGYKQLAKQPKQSAFHLENISEYITNKASATPAGFKKPAPPLPKSKSAREHPKWPEFVSYCKSQKANPGTNGHLHDGIPTKNGFRTWLGKQAFQRRATDEEWKRMAEEVRKQMAEFREQMKPKAQ